MVVASGAFLSSTWVSAYKEGKGMIRRDLMSNLDGSSVPAIQVMSGQSHCQKNVEAGLNDINTNHFH